MNKINLAVIFGGCSSEYEVSLKSATSVIKNINNEKYNLILVGITRQGKWYRYYGDIENIINDKWHMNKVIPSIISPCRDLKGLIEFNNDGYSLTNIDLVFPILHGKNGEDGTIQGLLDMTGIKYVGCNLMSSAICMDKDIAHALVEKAGIRVAKSLVITNNFNELEIQNIINEIGYPMYIKPARAGSSIGITKAHSYDELVIGIKEALKHDSKVVVEENIVGNEIGCAVIGNENLNVGEIDEIELNSDFFDYEEKYSLKETKIYLPARVDNNKSTMIKETAKRIYSILNCSGLARVDMFLTKDGEIVFNEVNTMPGFTDKSRYPNMLKATGIKYEEIIDKLIELAIEGDKSEY